MSLTGYQIYEADFTKKALKDLKWLLDKYDRKSNHQVMQGRNRNVFFLKDGIVVKIPSCINGIIDNDWEGSISKSDDPDDIQYARTRLTYYKGIPVVFMEYVEFAGKRKIEEKLGHEPDWVMSVDCGQVGFNSKGKLVAFDYGRT